MTERTEGLGYEKNNRSAGMRDPDGKNSIKTVSRFNNMVVPRFDCGGCWQQHLQIIQAIVKSNGWSEGTAALQLFAHLDGEALNAALLMPVEEREKWEDLSHGLSEYYNSPGRLAAFRRRFESASRRSGVDPATFATEVGILAVRGFGDMESLHVTRWSDINLLQPNGIVGYVNILMVVLRILPSGIL